MSKLGLTRKLTVIAQDPSVRVAGAGSPILRAVLEIPAEELDPGPWGYRVHVVDYDASTDTLYAPKAYPQGEDPFAGATDEELLSDPAFHAQNVYAIVMSILAKFELALGRRVAWGFKGHQLKIAPHAFSDANAFYSAYDQAIFFGYFPDRTRASTIFTSLSHDVIAHETTHAILDGLRPRYKDPSSPDQAAFHEGFADIVALLSVFAQREVVDAVLDQEEDEAANRGAAFATRKKQLEAGILRTSVLFGLAKQMGEELQSIRGSALRRSLELQPDVGNPRVHLDAAEFQEPHRRGEILVAAMLGAFVDVWTARILSRGATDKWERRNRAVEAEEGASIADRLLKIAIRAIDYAPPVDLQFGDYLSALLTADRELFRDDSTYEFRKHIPRTFAAYGILPASRPDTDGTWTRASALDTSRNHFESLQRDPDEMFRFIWENRRELALYQGSYCRVLSVRPVLRVGTDDGFFLRETVAEYVETLHLTASELGSVLLDGATPLKAPRGMPRDTEVTLYGGGVLIFDEFGQVKFHVKNRIDSPAQQARLEHLWRSGSFLTGNTRGTPFSVIHRRRATPVTSRQMETW